MNNPKNIAELVSSQVIDHLDRQNKELEYLRKFYKLYTCRHCNRVLEINNCFQCHEKICYSCVVFDNCSMSKDQCKEAKERALSKLKGCKLCFGICICSIIDKTIE